MHKPLELSAVAAALSLSTASTQRLLESGAIPSSLNANGHRVADLDAVRAWRDQREAQRRSIADLTRAAQRQEGSAPRRPPGAIGDINADDCDDESATPS